MTVSVFYPDADPETTSVDGVVSRASVNETFGTIRGGAGTLSFDDGAIFGLLVQVEASVTTDQFASIWRSILLFDTSALPDTDTISAAVMAIKNTAKNTGLGDDFLEAVASTPASDTGLVAADYGQLGSTSFGSSVNFSTMSAGTYYDITLNAGGVAAVSKVGVSKFGLRSSWDRSGTFGGTWTAFLATNAQFNEAQTTGTTSDPKLTVTHAAAVTFTPRSVVIT